MKKCLLLFFLFIGYFQTGNLWAVTQPRVEVEKSKLTHTSIPKCATNKKTHQVKKRFLKKSRKDKKQKIFLVGFKKIIKRLAYWTDRFTAKLVARGGALSIILPIIGFISGFYILLPIAYIAAIFTMIFAIKMRRAGNNSGKVQFGFMMSLIVLFFGTLFLVPYIVVLIYLKNSEP